MIIKGIRGFIIMLKPSRTNQVIKAIASITVIASLIIAMFTISAYQYTELHSIRWLIGIVIFATGAFNSLFLFAISEALSRLQEVEYNTERTYSEIERINRRASS